MLSLTSSSFTHDRFLLQRNPKFHVCNHRRNPNLFLIQSYSSSHEIKNSSVSEETENFNSILPFPTENFNSILPFPSIKAAKRVVLVRHGQSTWNEEGRIQGSSNFSVLTQKGEAQAETSRQMLIDDTFDVCFNSPLNRSKRTAEIIWGTRKEAMMIPDYDLREIDLYSFQGLLKHEGKAKFGEAYLQWQTDAPNFNIDGHYPVRELWERARNCWNGILNHEGKSVLVVAHNAVNQALVATAMGLGTKYFRVLLQSNCGVSVLDFTPQAQGESPHICLNRLNQTPNSPIAVTSSAGRNSSKRIILACYGPSLGNIEATSPSLSNGPMNMLGIIQSQKTAEFLLDLKVSSIICSPYIPSIDTAMAISKVQEAADCLGADSVPRHVEMKQLKDLEVEPILQQSNKDTIKSSDLQPGWLNCIEDNLRTEIWSKSRKAWSSLLEDLSAESDAEKNLVVVGHPGVHIGLIGHCLKLTKEFMGSFHLNDGSISIIDFPDGVAGGGVIRCVNYTAHLGRWSIPVTRPAMDDKEL